MLRLKSKHRVLCGDCTKQENIERLMNGEKADMVFTDPPYNVGGKTSCLGSDVNKSVAALKNASWDQNFDIKKVLELIPGVCKAGCSFYIFTSKFLAPDIWEWMSKECSFYSFLIWCKPNPMPSLTKKTWNFSSTELICYGHKPGYYFKYTNEGHDYAFWTFTKMPSKDHPTSKPVDVCVHGITHSSRRDGLVWDGFLGSGSTLIACEKTNRKCYGMEIDPLYVDVIVKRWETFSDKQAVLASQ